MSVDLALTSIPSAEVESLIGTLAAKALTVSLLALTVYEYFITLDEEQKYFWSKRFSITHVLFYFNRYIPPLVVAQALTIFFALDPSHSFCSISINVSFFGNLVGICIVQAILITRVWFLFPGDKRIQFCLMFAFLLSIVASFIFFFLVTREIRILPSSKSHLTIFRGCFAARPSASWRVYLPSLILHTGLYILTAYQAITNEDCKRHENLRTRLIRDGGIFYFIVICSVGFTTAGSFLAHIPQINIPAIFSPVALVTISLATTRIMFSLHEVMSVEPSWLPIQNHPISSILADDREKDIQV